MDIQISVHKIIGSLLWSQFHCKFLVISTKKIQRYPAAAAPAKPKDEWDYEGEFWTSWYNTDTPSDEIEDETLQRIQTRYRKDFQEKKKNISFNLRNDYLFLTDKD